MFIFLAYSRLTDELLSGLSLPLIFSIAALVSLAASGGLLEALATPAARQLLAFTGWLALATPFSFWRGGSVEVVTSWSKSALVFVLLAGLIKTPAQGRKTAGTLAAASLAVILQALLLGDRADFGRLSVGQGTLGNPNDLAQIVLTGAPFLLLPIIEKWNLPVRVVSAVGLVGAVYVVGATGSRSGLLAAVVMVGLMLMRVPLGTRLRFVAAGALALALAIPFLPPEVTRRYSTIFRDASADESDVAAVASREQRVRLIKESLALTARHPLFGVGPGMFAAVSAEAASTEGRRASWRDTHNTYTQVSAEAGIPALLFFLGALAYSVRVASRLGGAASPSEMTGLGHLPDCVRLTLWGYVVACFFASIAYEIYLPTLAGLAVAMDSASRAREGLVEPTPRRARSI